MKKPLAYQLGYNNTTQRDAGPLPIPHNSFSDFQMQNAEYCDGVNDGISALKAQLAAITDAARALINAPAIPTSEHNPLVRAVRDHLKTTTPPQPYASAPALLAACKEAFSEFEGEPNAKAYPCSHALYCKLRDAIRSAEPAPTTPAKEYSGQSEAKPDREMPWCEACRSYHIEPRSLAEHAALKCFAPWTENDSVTAPRRVCMQCGDPMTDPESADNVCRNCRQETTEL